MKKAHIKAVEYYLPEKTISNDDIKEEFSDFSSEKLYKKIGVSERHISSVNQTSLDMAEVVTQNLLNNHKIDKECIDYVLLCTQSPDYFLPTSACILQNRLSLRKNIGALDFNLGCSGYIYGLSVAKGLIYAGIADNVLLVTSETYSKFIHPKDKINKIIFGDASSATLISVDGVAEIKDFSLGTDGSGYNDLIVKTGGLRNKSHINDLEFDDMGNPTSSDYLFMNGSKIFNFTLENVPQLVKEVLLKNKLSKEDVSTYIFHQANKYMLEFLRKKAKIPKENFYQYFENVGNTVSSTIPIALFEALEEGVISKNTYTMLVGFGVGLSWGGVILKF